MVAKMHRKHFPKVGEGVIHLPSGMPFEADDDPLYPAGAYVRLGGKEFIYAIAGGGVVPDRGAMNSHTQTIVEKETSAIIPKGAMVITLTIGSGLDIAKDALAGGEIVCFPGDDTTFLRGIISNNQIKTADGGTLSVVIDSPTPVEIAKTKWCECMPNPYSSVKKELGDWFMVMGMPTVVATEGQGLWLQVSGPSWASPVYGAGGPGGADRVLECVFVGDGSIAVRGIGDDKDRQLAGVVILTKAGTGQASPFIMLQIAH